ncbi:acyltransferase [Streptomyces sp. NPDC059639]|uniref:acyltransferase n=1 Tax=Streptomyces sp. NPDC059639 TaxID=3346891 RepID=UPI0036BB6B1F
MTLGTEELLRLTVTALMSRAGERQGDLAGALGQAQAQVSRKQTGKQHWTLADVDVLAAHYGIGVLDLLAGPTHAATAYARSSGTDQTALAVAATAAAVPRSEALSGPCVLCGQMATDAVEGMWQHLTSEECAEAASPAVTPEVAPQEAELAPEDAPQAPVEPSTAPQAPVTPDVAPTPAAEVEVPAEVAPLAADRQRPAPAGDRSGAYASAYLVDRITDRVREVLNDVQGDVEAAEAALIKRAIPDVMDYFERSRVGGRYAHSKFPPTDEILKKKSQKGSDSIWEGRPKWRNKMVAAAIKTGAQFEVTGLDMNAAYLSAFKCWLPVGKLVEDESGEFDKKRSGVYLITPSAWEHEGLPSPMGARKEAGPVWVPDPLLRTLLYCAEEGLCEAPAIHRAMLSGATESLLEKLRRALAESRTKALAENDEMALAYVKSMYSKFVSTIGESSANTDIRRPDWMHIIRSKAFTNLWLKAYKAHKAGLTVVEMSGTDELHVSGDWQPLFPEGRALNQVKAKKAYTLGGSQ